MTFDEWWVDLSGNIVERIAQENSWKPIEDAARSAWAAAQRELLLELTNAKLDGADMVIAGEMQRVKNFRSLL